MSWCSWVAGLEEAGILEQRRFLEERRAALESLGDQIYPESFPPRLIAPVLTVGASAQAATGAPQPPGHGPLPLFLCLLSPQLPSCGPRGLPSSCHHGYVPEGGRGQGEEGRRRACPNLRSEPESHARCRSCSHPVLAECWGHPARPGRLGNAVSTGAGGEWVWGPTHGLCHRKE